MNNEPLDINRYAIHSGLIVSELGIEHEYCSTGFWGRR